MGNIDYSSKPLLRVENLQQFFKFGKKWLKAVNDVSFDIYKGEVFGLVGESGCGKTTTGRSIIRLYDITGGNVYFNDVKICAGTNSYKEKIGMAKAEYQAVVKKFSSFKFEMNLEIKKAKQECINEITKIKLDSTLSPALVESKVQNANVTFTNKILEIQNAYAEKIKNKEIEIAEAKAKYNAIYAENIALIKQAKYDHKHYSKEFTANAVNAVKAKYEPLLANRKEIPELSADEKASYKEYLKEVKTTETSTIKEKEIEAINLRYSGLLEKVKRNEELREEDKNLLNAYKSELNIAKKDNIMNKIQMIFQDPIASLDPRMTVHDIIAEGLIIRGIKDKKYIDEKVYRVLELVGLVPEHATRYPHEFSGGQRQRIGIARAIILEPEIIIADEPISALDVSIQAQVINLLNELREKMGLTILFIAHDLSVVKYFSDRIAVMYFGNLVELASSDELFDHPLHPYTKSLLSAIPLPDPHYEKNRKRITYNPLAAHDYSKQKPTLREIVPGHFILCNDAEENAYKEEIKKIDERK